MRQALECGDESCARWLMERGADVWLADAEGTLPVHHAAANWSVHPDPPILAHNGRLVCTHTRLTVREPGSAKACSRTAH